MFLVGTAYNFVWPHEGLRLRTLGPGHRWQERTPAMAAGLTDHPWTMEDLLRYQVPPTPWVPLPRPKRRGRPEHLLHRLPHDHAQMWRYRPMSGAAIGASVSH